MRAESKSLGVGGLTKASKERHSSAVSKIERNNKPTELTSDGNGASDDLARGPGQLSEQLRELAIEAKGKIDAATTGDSGANTDAFRRQALELFIAELDLVPKEVTPFEREIEHARDDLGKIALAVERHREECLRPIVEGLNRYLAKQEGRTFESVEERREFASRWNAIAAAVGMWFRDPVSGNIGRLQVAAPAARPGTGYLQIRFVSKSGVRSAGTAFRSLPRLQLEFAEPDVVNGA